MLYYSFACGVSGAGIALILMVVIQMLINSAVASNARGVFKTNYGIQWGMIFLVIVALGTTSWGLFTVGTLGYQPLDLVAAIIVFVLVFAVAMTLSQMLNKIRRRAHP